MIDCDVSHFGPWSICDVSCGLGKMTRSRVVLREPENGGKHCPTLVQSRSCQGGQCANGTNKGGKGKCEKKCLSYLSKHVLYFS